jgi:hypothetical protein
VVDAGRVWRTQPESGIHWHVVVFVRGHGWNLSILFLFAPHQPFWPAACLRFQHRLVRRDLAIFPFENLAVVAGGGPNLVVWLLISLQLSSYCVFDMGYGEYLCHTP